MLYSQSNQSFSMSSSSQNSSIYANSLFGKELPKKRIPEQSLDPKTAYRLIHDELATQGNPMLNMASFVKISEKSHVT